MTHNIPLLREVYTHPRFQAGRLSTKFLPEEFPGGFQGKQLAPSEVDELLGTAVEVHRKMVERQSGWLEANTGACRARAHTRMSSPARVRRVCAPRPAQCAMRSCTSPSRSWCASTASATSR